MAAQKVSSESSSSLSSVSSVRGPVGNQFPIPVYGTISFKGHSPNMNDRWHVKENFCRPNIVDGLPLHFFAVYDGHGSYHVSSLCKNLMHTIVVEDLMGVHTPQQGMDEKVWEDFIQTALKNSFQRMDQVALSTRSCDEASYICRCPPILCNFLGSTANIVFLSLVTAFPQSRDHKPTRQDELERIYAVGAKLINKDGLRVNGILNTTRAIDLFRLLAPLQFLSGLLASKDKSYKLRELVLADEVPKINSVGKQEEGMLTSQEL